MEIKININYFFAVEYVQNHKTNINILYTFKGEFHTIPQSEYWKSNNSYTASGMTARDKQHINYKKELQSLLLNEDSEMVEFWEKMNIKEALYLVHKTWNLVSQQNIM